MLEAVGAVAAGDGGGAEVGGEGVAEETAVAAAVVGLKRFEWFGWSWDGHCGSEMFWLCLVEGVLRVKKGSMYEWIRK